MTRFKEPSERPSPGTHEELEAKVRELNVKLAIANEALRVESAKHEQAKKDLEEFSRKVLSLSTYAAESSDIVQRMEEELGQAAQMEELGKVTVPALMHDLGNLLGAIKSHAQFCREHMDSASSFMGENLEMIFDCSQKAGNLVRDFLVFFKSVKFNKLDFKSVDVNQGVTRVWNAVRIQAFSRQISFSVELDENLPEVKGDAEKLERVLLNLFLNSIQAVPERGRIVVRTRPLPSEQKIEIQVADDGPGIPEKYRQRIFEPFFTTKQEGTGLGLSICHFIVQQHKGSITYEENRPKGATFSIRLPAIPRRELLKPSDKPTMGMGAIGGTEIADTSQ